MLGRTWIRQRAWTLPWRLIYHHPDRHAAPLKIFVFGLDFGMAGLSLCGCILTSHLQPVMLPGGTARHRPRTCIAHYTAGRLVRIRSPALRVDTLDVPTLDHVQTTQGIGILSESPMRWIQGTQPQQSLSAPLTWPSLEVPDMHVMVELLQLSLHPSLLKVIILISLVITYSY